MYVQLFISCSSFLCVRLCVREQASERVRVCMYVFTHACMQCMYVRMYVCMRGARVYLYICLREYAHIRIHCLYIIIIKVYFSDNFFNQNLCHVTCSIISYSAIYVKWNL